MGYTLNLCKTHNFVVPYNQNSGKEGIRMQAGRAIPRLQLFIRRHLLEPRLQFLEAMRDGAECKKEIVLPVELIKRESTRKL